MINTNDKIVSMSCRFFNGYNRTLNMIIFRFFAIRLKIYVNKDKDKDKGIK